MHPRRTSIRRLLALAVPLLSLAAPAAQASDNGAIDGLYQCQVSYLNTTEAVFLSVNGKSDGKSIYLIAATNHGGIYGFGSGLVSGKSFSGNTSANAAFNFTLGFGDQNSDGSADQVSLKGTAGVLDGFKRAVKATFDCKSVW
jgi:hypothetical protein